VEAIQCIKCAMQHDLLFCEPVPSLILEEEASDQKLESMSTDLGEGLGESDDELDIEESSWDDLLIKDDDDNATYYAD